MKPRTKTLLIAGLLVLAVAPWAAPAVAGGYLTANAGVFVPRGDVDDQDPGPTMNLVYGFPLLPMLLGEVGAGYAKADDGDTELEVAPLTLNGKLRLPFPVAQPYVLAGVGAYLTSVDTPGFGSDRDTGFGYQAALGVDFTILMAKVNLELEYFWADAELYGETVNMEGLLATVGAGFEF